MIPFLSRGTWTKKEPRDPRQTRITAKLSLKAKKSAVRQVMPKSKVRDKVSPGRERRDVIEGGYKRFGKKARELPPLN